MAMRFPSSRTDCIQMSVPVHAVQIPASAQGEEFSPDVPVDAMEASPCAPICVGVMRTNSFGDDASKVHRATLAHDYPTRSSVKKRTIVDTSAGLVPGAEVFEI